MATGPSLSSVQCLNCIVSSFLFAPVRARSALSVSRENQFGLAGIFDFWGGLVHARQRRLTCVIQTWKRLMSIFDLSGRVAVVTGGNGGIGLGIAQALVTSGCAVSIWGRNEEKNRAAAATLAKGPGEVDTRICDVSNPASVAEA